MNILIIGNGGREHTFAWKIKQSKLCDKLFVAPGNAGTAAIAKNVDIRVDDFEKLGNFCLSENIELVVVGPELPLVKGIRDHYEQNESLRDILFVGPGKDGARLEGSKDFSKQFMLKYGIPTAQAKTFSVAEIQSAVEYLESCKTPIVLKADGLAAGKGVIITDSRQEAMDTIREMLVDKKFGEASTRVLIEEYLSGIELSVFVLTDGTDFIILPEAKDYKRIGEKDTGPNTGGMGAVSPVVFANTKFMQKVEERIVKPTLTGLQKENIKFKGFIFIGLMNCNGDPYVIEYNVRMGDPETQAVLPRIKTDLVELLVATANGRLNEINIEVDHNHAVTVVMVSEGYPGDYAKGKSIKGFEDSGESLVFHAGTKLNTDYIVTDGGRVLAVTGMGKGIELAREKAYAGVSKLSWDGLYFRNDIGLDLITLQKDSDVH